MERSQKKEMLIFSVRIYNSISCETEAAALTVQKHIL